MVPGRRTTKPVYVFRNAEQILTFSGGPFRGEFTEKSVDIHRNSTIVVKRGRIAWIGPDAEYDKRDVKGYPVHEFDVSGKVILPGLVDPHTHMIYSGSRLADWIGRFGGLSYRELAEHSGGIHHTIEATRAARDDTLRNLLQRRLDRIMAYGITTVEIKTGYGMSKRDEFRFLRILQGFDRSHPMTVVPTFLPAHALPLNNEKAGYIQSIIEDWVPEVGRHRWAGYFDVFCDDGFYSVEDTLAMVAQAKACGLSLRLHVDELSDTGLLSRIEDWKGLHAVDHLEHMNPQYADVLAENDVAAGLLPATWFHMGLPRPPVRELEKSGVVMTLGSDHNPGTNPVLNPWYTLWLACVGWNIPVHQALAAMTVNAAFSLRIHGRRGRLATGTAADFIIIDVPHYGYLPYQWDLLPIDMVVKNGRPYRIREDARIESTWMRYETNEV